MRKILWVLIVVAACGDVQEIANHKVTRCEQLREHMIDLRLAESSSLEKEAHREAMRGALGHDFLLSCSHLDDTAVACALGASDSSAAIACSSR